MTLVDGCVAYWKLDESSGDAIDSVNGYDGTVYGCTQGVDGKINTCYSFDGNDYIEKSFESSLNPDIFSVSLWVKSDGPDGQYHSPITSRDITPQRGYIIYQGNNNKWEFWIGTGVAWATIYGNNVTTNWIHLVAVYDGTNMRLYENGILTAGPSANSFSKNTVRPIRIGTGSTEGAPQLFFNGLIDEIGLWNKALSPEEVTTLYNDGSGFTFPFNRAMTRFGGGFVFSKSY